MTGTPFMHLPYQFQQCLAVLQWLQWFQSCLAACAGQVQNTGQASCLALPRQVLITFGVITIQCHHALVTSHYPLFHVTIH